MIMKRGKSALLDIGVETQRIIAVSVWVTSIVVSLGLVTSAVILPVFYPTPLTGCYVLCVVSAPARIPGHRWFVYRPF